MYLLDTNICIYFIKKKPLHLVNKVKSNSPFDLKLSAVTIAELQYKKKNANLIIANWQ